MGFFGGLFGGSQRKKLRQAEAKATENMNLYSNLGRENEERWYDKSMDFLRPQLESGNRALETYETALGLRGKDAQAGYFAEFENDPGFKAGLDAGTDAVQKNAAARGFSLSGRALKELQDYGQRYQSDAYDKRMTRIGDLAGKGRETAVGAANLTSNTGGRLSQSYYNQGGNLANINLQTGAALADTYFSMGDLSNLIAAGVSAYARSDIRVKHDIDRIGVLPSGLLVYRFRYIDQEGEHIGVMAQEAMEMFPDAVAEIGGVLHVNYSAIG